MNFGYVNLYIYETYIVRLFTIPTYSTEYIHVLPGSYKTYKIPHKASKLMINMTLFLNWNDYFKYIIDSPKKAHYILL